MKQQYVALADLVGQLLAERWIQEYEQHQRDVRPNVDRPTEPRTTKPVREHDGKEDV